MLRLSKEADAAVSFSADLAAESIAQDKYLTLGGMIDAVLAGDCTIYDLADEAVDTRVSIDDLVEDEGDKLTAYAVYGTKEKVVTSVCVAEKA